MLSAGALVALMFDYALRVVRSNMMEREAVGIDTEVSEFFFARSGEIRLDARGTGIGTMASQLRGLEQVRQMLSSSVVFAPYSARSSRPRTAPRARFWCSPRSMATRL